MFWQNAELCAAVCQPCERCTGQPYCTEGLGLARVAPSTGGGTWRGRSLDLSPVIGPAIELFGPVSVLVKV